MTSRRRSERRYRLYMPQMRLSAGMLPFAEPLRLIVGVITVELLYALGLHMFDEGLLGSAPDLIDGIYDGDTAAGLLLQLSSFAVMSLSVVIVVRYLHERDPRLLIGPPRRALHDLGRTFAGSLAVLLLLMALPPWNDLTEVSTIRPLGGWLALLIPAMLSLLIQTSAEELLYRGYMQQTLAARFHNPLIWMVLPNLLFASAHWANGVDWSDSCQYVIWAFFFGLAASDLVARSGNLGASIGMHLANNAYSFLLFGDSGGYDSGLALLLYPAYSDPGTGGSAQPPVLDLAFAEELVVLGLTWLGARLALRR